MLKNILKIIIFIPASILAYIAVLCLFWIWFSISNFVFGSDDVHEVIAFFKTDSFERIGYIKGIYWLAVVRIAPTYFFFTTAISFFPSNQKFVFGVTVGIFIFLFLVGSLKIGIDFIHSYTNIDSIIRTVIEDTMIIGVIIYIYKSIED